MVVYENPRGPTPLLQRVSLETGRKWCLGGTERIVPQDYDPDGLCLYIGNVLEWKHLYRAFQLYRALYKGRVNLIILSTHSRGIYNLALHAGMKPCLVPIDKDDFEGTRFVGEIEQMQNLEDKFAPIIRRVEKELCQI